MTETATFQRDGYTYELRHMPALEGLRAGARLANAVGAGLVGGDAGLLEIAGRLLRSPDLGADAEYLCKAFAPYTTVHVDGRAQTLDKLFDAHFAGRYDALIEWLSFAIKWDLSSFLAGLPKAWAAAVAGAAKIAPVSPSKPQEPASKTG